MLLMIIKKGYSCSFRCSRACRILAFSIDCKSVCELTKLNLNKKSGNIEFIGAKWNQLWNTKAHSISITITISIPLIVWPLALAHNVKSSYTRLNLKLVNNTLWNFHGTFKPWIVLCAMCYVWNARGRASERVQGRSLAREDGRVLM